MSSNRRRRNFSGIPEKSCSMESTPIAASISCRSVRELGIYLIVSGSTVLRIVVVLCGGHQLRRFAFVAEADSNHPTRTIGICVDGFGCVTQTRIDLCDFARGRSE